MSLYHAARIIHDPVECTYTIEVKKRWWSVWQHCNAYWYSPEARPLTQDLTQEEALTYARKQKKSIESSEVVE